MNEEKDLEKLFAFALEIDKEKEIFRQTDLSDVSRKENDAEHAWHMAVMTLLLSSYANKEIDVLKTISMLLIHDLVEIDAGDTYAYDEVGKKTQKEREQKAAERLFGMLPCELAQKFGNLWREFENGETAEAKFAHTMDNIQPMMLNAATGGKMWKERGIHLSQILERNAHTAEGSQALWDYANSHFIAPNLESGSIKKDGE